MTDIRPTSIKAYKELTEGERKKVKKDVLESLLLESPETDKNLAEAIRKLHELIDDFRKEIRENSTQIVALKAELELVKDNNRQMCKEFTARINNMEQRSRINNIEIVGLDKPGVDETDLELSQSFLNDVMEAGIEESDIEALHEVPSRRKDKKRVIICHLKSRKKRDDLLNRKAVHQKKLRERNEAFGSSRVYVNEHLSPGNRKLFAMASQKKFEMKFKFLWTKNGVVFVRKDENANVIKIESPDDIDKMS